MLHCRRQSMSRLVVCSAVVALWAVAGTAPAQSWGLGRYTNRNQALLYELGDGLDKPDVSPFADPWFTALTNLQTSHAPAAANEAHDYGLFAPIFDTARMTGPRESYGREPQVQPVPDSYSGLGLLDSFPGAEGNDPWKLFLTDMDFGGPGSGAQWSVVISAIPEPSSCGLLGLGGLLLGRQFLRRRKNL
jgi:hypothetical protein